MSNLFVPCDENAVAAYGMWVLQNKDMAIPLPDRFLSRNFDDTVNRLVVEFDRIKARRDKISVAGVWFNPRGVGYDTEDFADGATQYEAMETLRQRLISTTRSMPSSFDSEVGICYVQTSLGGYERRAAVCLLLYSSD